MRPRSFPFANPGGVLLLSSEPTTRCKGPSLVCYITKLSSTSLLPRSAIRRIFDPQFQDSLESSGARLSHNLKTSDVSLQCPANQWLSVRRTIAPSVCRSATVVELVMRSCSLTVRVWAALLALSVISRGYPDPGPVHNR